MKRGTREQLSLERLGHRVRTARLGKSISQEELAARAGVHRTYIGMIERGEKNVTMLSLLKISSALGVSISDFLDGFENGE